MKEEENNEMNKLKEQFMQQIREMSAVAYMCANAPKDEKGNVVVSIVGIKSFGIFYLFEN